MDLNDKPPPYIDSKEPLTEKPTLTKPVPTEPTQPYLGETNHINFDKAPKYVVCQNCAQTVTTKVSHKTGLGTWLICLGISSCMPIFCCFPFFNDSCKDVQHDCPNCGGLIGYKRIVGN